MKITAITTFKHGELLALLKKLGWTQKELAQRAGLSTTRVTRIVGLRQRATAKVADKLQRAFADAGEYLDVIAAWPEAFVGLRARVEQTEDISVERLCDHPEVLQLPNNCPKDFERLHTMLEELTERERTVLDAVYGENATYEQAGRAIGTTRERARQIKLEALRRLRHPARLPILEEEFRA